MTIIATELLIPLIMVIASGLMGYIVWILQQQRKEAAEMRKVTAEEFQAIKKGLTELLLQNIMESHEKYVIKDEPLTVIAFNRVTGLYNAYKNLGGNGGADKMMKEINNESIDGGNQ